jgi:hypothetical protein
MQTIERDIGTKKVGGWLLVMTIVLMYVGPIISIFGTFARITELERFASSLPASFGFYRIFSWFFILVFSFISYLAGYELKNNLVPETVPKAKKRILIFFIGGTAVQGLILPFIFFKVTAELAITGLISVLFAFFIGWLYNIYLSKSKRVRDTYGLLTPKIDVPEDHCAQQLEQQPTAPSSNAPRRNENLEIKTLEFSASSMNALQKNILMALGIVIFLMFLYPPYRVYGAYSSVSAVIVDSGYALIFDLPYRATMDIAALLVQWVGACLVGGLAFFIFKTK